MLSKLTDLYYSFFSFFDCLNYSCNLLKPHLIKFNLLSMYFQSIFSLWIDCLNSNCSFYNVVKKCISICNEQKLYLWGGLGKLQLAKMFISCLWSSFDYVGQILPIIDPLPTLGLQVNLCQKLSFLNQLTHNMTRDWSLNSRKIQVQNMLFTAIVLNVKTKTKNNIYKKHVLNLYFWGEFNEQSLVILLVNWRKNEGF